MKIDMTTRKLYFGFPVILIGYKDKKWGYNVTAGSSSYSLGRTITIGLVAENNAAKNIKAPTNTENVPTLNFFTVYFNTLFLLPMGIPLLSYKSYTNFIDFKKINSIILTNLVY